MFVCSHSDWFIDEADFWRPEAWEIIRKCPSIIFQILTKRPERIGDHLPSDWGEGYPNVWLGVSVELQQYAKRMKILREIPCALRFVSAEPQLGSITWELNGFGWFIDGGESDPSDRPRPAKPEWFFSNREQCLAAGIPYFHKQNGGMKHCACHGIWGCSLLDGQIYNAMPLSIQLDERMRTTHIGWTLRSWNPWYGCKRVSPGCKKCYCLERTMKRLGVPLGEIRRSKTTFYNPLKWERKLREQSPATTSRASATSTANMPCHSDSSFQPIILEAERLPRPPHSRSESFFLDIRARNQEGPPQ